MGEEDHLPATSLSTSISQPGLWPARCVSTFFTRPSTFLRKASTVSFDNPKIVSVSTLRIRIESNTKNGTRET